MWLTQTRGSQAAGADLGTSLIRVIVFACSVLLIGDTEVTITLRGSQGLRKDAGPESSSEKPVVKLGPDGPLLSFQCSRGPQYLKKGAGALGQVSSVPLSRAQKVTLNLPPRGQTYIQHSLAVPILTHVSETCPVDAVQTAHNSTLLKQGGLERHTCYLAT